jgi:hypothetical protein
MRHCALAIALVTSMLALARPADAQVYGPGFMRCAGAVYCCSRMPVVVRKSVTGRLYRRDYRSRRTVVRSYRLDGFIPEIASRRAACCAY